MVLYSSLDSEQAFPIQARWGLLEGATTIMDLIYCTCTVGELVISVLSS
jgi:hypothetical protein